MRFSNDQSKHGSQASIGRSVLVCALLFLTGAITTRVSAVTPAVLIDTQLEPHRVNIQGLVDGVISYFDAERRLQMQPMTQFVQVRIVKHFSETGPGDTVTDTSPTGRSDESAGVLELVDGQRFVGRWVGVDAQAQALIWQHPSLVG